MSQKLTELTTNPALSTDDLLYVVDANTTSYKTTVAAVNALVPVASAAATGTVTTGTQTIAGNKTFTGNVTAGSGTIIVDPGGSGLITKQSNIWLDSWATHSAIRHRRAEGTSASPSRVTNNVLLGRYGVAGYHSGGSYHTNQSASVAFWSTEDYTSGACGAKIVFATTPNGTAVSADILVVENTGVTHYAKLVGQNAEVTNTPSGTTQTITLNNGNHQTLTLTSATGGVTATITVPSKVSSGTIIVKQHATTPRNITWAVSAGSIKWLGTQPTWSSDAVNAVRIVNWRWDGSIMYLSATGAG